MSNIFSIPVPVSPYRLLIPAMLSAAILPCLLAGRQGLRGWLAMMKCLTSVTSPRHRYRDQGLIYSSVFIKPLSFKASPAFSQARSWVSPDGHQDHVRLYPAHALLELQREPDLPFSIAVTPSLRMTFMLFRYIIEDRECHIRVDRCDKMVAQLYYRHFYTQLCEVFGRTRRRPPPTIAALPSAFPNIFSDPNIGYAQRVNTLRHRSRECGLNGKEPVDMISLS